MTRDVKTDFAEVCRAWNEAICDPLNYRMQ